MVRFFGANDRFTLDEAIDYLRFEQSKQFNYAGALRKKADRDRAEYAGQLLTEIIRTFEETRDNGATPLFILEKLGKAEQPKADDPLPYISGLDDIQDSILPGGKLYVRGEAPEDHMEFINWLADQLTRVAWIQEIIPGEFGIGQYVLDADTIRRVIMASRADTICVRTRQPYGQTTTHTFDRGTWLNATLAPNEKLDTNVFERLNIPQPTETR